jgi:hypothetical protein
MYLLKLALSPMQIARQHTVNPQHVRTTAGFRACQFAQAAAAAEMYRDARRVHVAAVKWSA